MQKMYLIDSITTMSCTYALKVFSEQLNEIKVDNHGLNPLGNFAGTTIYITLKNHHTCGFPFYVSDTRLQGNIDGLPKCERRSFAWIYLGR